MDSEQTHEHQLASRDHLSPLPVEILSEIFKLAYTPSSPPTGPICRALLPFDRSARFHRLEVKSVQQLRKLAELVEEGAMGRYVRELKLEDVDSESGVGLKERQLKSFFASLPHLLELDLGKGCHATLRLLLSHALTRASLRSMTKLSVEAVDGKNPFDPAPYRLLNSYPALTSLSITSEKPWHDLARVKVPKKKVEPLGNIHELTLTSKGADLPLVAFFVGACPTLTSLVLVATSWPTDFRALIPLLPVDLKRLEFRTPPSQPTDPNQPCDDLLSRFTNLEHLYLSDGMFRSNIFDLVRTFPRLSSLGFGFLAFIDCKDLLTLVDGPTCFKQLKTLTLDIAKGKRGWCVQADGHGSLHPDADPHLHLGPGWDVPFFTRREEGFHEADAADVLEAAKRNGIEVKGTTEEAVAIVWDYYTQVGMAAEMYAFETGDFDELREIMGDEYVNGLLYELDESAGCECGGCW
ncbi:hypothetical protein JCM6882_002671 [Rhodosporidiobolus microsporus]